ncbi:uncharacterized protein LOC131942800 isoform X2 [Physella acuta]|uniref:uncharacterized protein LOC131942800 isoform X2 n=1 Tax=Physella acuta TaxID=109671 RepID=UPI0027DDE5FE|nr:uncharacterized protein LOC131942800 isoform X2 [Physella acuta]
MTDNQKQHPDRTLTSRVTISGKVDLKTVKYYKNPSRFGKIIFAIFVASSIITGYHFVTDIVFYNLYSRPFNVIETSSHDSYEGMKVFIFLSNSIAYVVVSLNIFTHKFRGSSCSAVITFWVSIFTYRNWRPKFHPHQTDRTL